MTNVLELADRLWRGEASVEDHHPLFGSSELAEIEPGVAFLRTFANVTAFATEEGTVLIDTGSAYVDRDVHRLIRSWSDARVHTAVYTHGHIDHVFGLGPFEEEAADRGWPAPVVVAHENVPRRFERYRLTAGYNAAINARQFGVEGLQWPTEYRLPDETYRERLTLEVGAEVFELTHAVGETDDHTWVWVPGRKALCTGDLFIWASPNAGNPQKVQRYPREWAAALREMASRNAEVLLPGHGWPILGAERVEEALLSTAELLEDLHDRTVELMNAGATLEEVLLAVQPAEDLIARPYLRPVYDDPEFVIRNVWRLYGGWWDGDPASLKPPRRNELAAEVASLAGGADRVAARAHELSIEGDLRLSGQLAEWAALAAPADDGIREVRREILRRRAEAETSTMAGGIFRAAADEPSRA